LLSVTHSANLLCCCQWHIQPTYCVAVSDTFGQLTVLLSVTHSANLLCCCQWHIQPTCCVAVSDTFSQLIVLLRVTHSANLLCCCQWHIQPTYCVVVSDTLSQLTVLLSVIDTFSQLVVLLCADRTNSTLCSAGHTNDASALFSRTHKWYQCPVQQDTQMMPVPCSAGHTNDVSALYLMKLTLFQNSPHRILGKPNCYALAFVLQPPTRTSTLRSDGSYKSIQGSAV